MFKGMYYIIYYYSNVNREELRSNFKDNEAFQFFKLHGMGRYTRVNMCPSLFGVYNQGEKEGQYFLKYYKDRGFITGSSINFCSKEFFEIEDKEMDNLKWASYDHEMVSLFCDPNFTPYATPFSIMDGPNSIQKRCLYGKHTLEHSLTYLKSFWTTYKDQPKFFRIGNIDSHEGTYESIKYDDEILYNFFTQFEKDGHLEDTIILVQSDHGNAQPGPFSILHLEDFFYELSLPSLFLLMPVRTTNYFNSIRRNLKGNEEAFITPFTVYNTLVGFLGDPSIPLSTEDQYSVFSPNIANNRNCNLFSIEDSLCRCAAVNSS
jgi:hypothetical protein